MKLALREDMTPGDTVAEKVAWLEGVGIEGIELHASALDLPPDDLRRAFEGRRVSVANVAGATTLLDADPAERERGMALTVSRLRLAAELGAGGVLLVPQFGRRPALPDLTPLASGAELERDLLVLQLRELAPTVASTGIPLFLEPLNRYEAYLVNRLEQGTAIAEEVGPQIGIMADFFHMHIEEADIPAAIRAAGERIVYVHVADSNRLQPGRGHLDFRPGFAALKEIGYDGYLGIECRIDGPFDDAVRDSADLVRRTWEAA